jgi:hypothetical protein
LIQLRLFEIVANCKVFTVNVMFSAGFRAKRGNKFAIKGQWNLIIFQIRCVKRNQTELWDRDFPHFKHQTVAGSLYELTYIRLNYAFHLNGQSDSSLKRIIPEPRVPSRGSQARGTRLPQRRLDSCHVKISTNEIALFFHRVCEDFWPSNLHWTQKHSKNI